MNFSAISIVMPKVCLSVDPQLRKKIIMRINLSVFLFFIVLTQISAKGYTQITIHKKNASLEKVVQAIESQSKYVFLFDEKELPVSIISVNLKNATIEEVLDACLKDLPVSYKIVDRNILLKPKELTLFDRLKKAFTLPLDLIVKITDGNGNPLPGATVKVINTNRTVLSDARGMFQLHKVDENATIEVSFMGYETMRVKVTSNLHTIQLKEVMAKLDEVVINKGYYTTTQKLNTGSVVQVTAADIEKQPLTNPIQAIQGMVPGMYIQQSSGVAGSATTIRIRGRNSINSGLIPLYVIDGVPFNGVRIDNQTSDGAIMGGQTNGATDPLNNINPADIESITILKDADATAIYGSRGSNGVVLITTKTGKGKAGLTLNYSRGIGEVTNQRNLLSSADYLALRNKAFANDNRVTAIANAPDLLVWSQTAKTDYQEMLVGNTAQFTDASASVAMGTEKSSILLSGTYHDEGSVIYTGGHYKRGGINMRATHSSDDNRFKIDFGANLTISENNMASADLTSTSLIIPSNFPLYDPAGKLYWITNFSNPLASTRASFTTTGNNTVLSANLSYLIMKGLTARARLGYNKVEQTQASLSPTSSMNPLYASASAGLYSGNDGKNYIAEPQLDYSVKLGKGTLNATVGGAWQQSLNSLPYFVYASGFASDKLMENYTNAGTFSVVKSASSEYKYISGYSLLNYNISDKYVINAAFRRDGSSRFGPARKYGNFGSVGAAWIFSEESFMKNLGVLSFGKIRSSYGVTGNDQITNYTYLDTYTSTYASYGGLPGFYPTRIANPTFSWETNRKMEVAAELGFFNDRLMFTGAYYQNRSNNMIVANTPVPSQTGFSSYASNLDAPVQNNGTEFEIKVVPVKTKDITWNVSFNISQSKNRLMDLPSSLYTVYGNTYQIGESLNSYVVYHFTGFVDGVAQFEDKNKDGSITAGLVNDGYIAGSRDPKFYGGLSSGLRYKNFQFDLLFNFVKQKGLMQTSFPGLLGSQTDDLLNSPFKASSLTSSAAYASYTRYLLSDAMITDASFIRLRNLSVSYSLPARWTDVIKVKQARIFLRGQNLFTITKYKGVDPETQGVVLPPLKMLTAGIQCSF